MNLKDFLTNHESLPELYWSLVLEPGLVQAGLWYIKNDAAEVVSVGPPSSWDNRGDLVEACDAALSSAIQKLPEGTAEPSKTVFGVSSAWVEGGEIKSDFLEIIKKVCTELSLNPVGFVVLPEAISHLYKSEEGSPTNAVILGLGKEFLELSVFKLGNLVGTTQISKSVSLADDVVEGLSRFEGASPLPSRIIVYDGKEGEIEEAKDILSAASWNEYEKIKFLHTPKIEALSPGKKVLAVSLAGANEIGSAVRVKTNDTEEPPVAEDANVAEPLDLKSAGEMGFVIGRDVSEGPIPAPLAPSAEFSEKPAGFAAKTAKTGNMLHSLSTKFFSEQGMNFQGPRGKIFLMLSALAAILLIGFAAWWYLPKATVSIYVSPKSFSQDVQTSLSADGVSDLEKGILPVKVLTSSASGEKTAKTSGSKLVGDKAKGSVNIRNATDKNINLAAGTIIVSSGDLNFTLDSTASVSALLDPVNPGTSSVEVTASVIGAEYNLAKGETFKVGNFSNVVDAVSVSDFSGGSSRQISAVSKEDQESLGKALLEELSQKAKDDMGSAIDENQILAGGPISIDKTEEKFSAKVGDEAESLKLNLEIETKGLSLEKDKFFEYAKNILKDKVPGGYVLRDDQINYEFEFLEADKNLYKFRVSLSANFLPQIKSDEIVKKISGKTPEVVENYLTSIAGYSHTEIVFNFKLPKFLRVLPHIGKNINLEISAER